MKKLNFLKPIIGVFLLLLLSQCEDTSVDYIQVKNDRGFVNVNQDANLSYFKKKFLIKWQITHNPDQPKL